MRPTFRCAFAFVVLMSSGSAAFAQATRTWVSGVGDDANPCSRTAPCKTFAGAISKTAAKGVISVLDPGGFGAVTITKSITIDGGGIDGSILASLTNGVIVNVAAADHVILRNLTIYGAGNGINGIRVIGASGHLTVDHCVVSGFGNGLDFNASGLVYVYDSVFSDNNTFGVIIRQGRATVEGGRFDDNTFDALRVTAAATAVVRRSVASGHTNVAFSAVGAGAVLTLEDSVSSGNAFGIGAMTGGAVTLSNTTVAGNTTQGVFNDGGTSSLLTFGNNRISGNAVNGTFTGSVGLQ